MVFLSHAKINVSLKVLGKRDDGYHDLEMVNLPLELHDVIQIDRIPEGTDTYIISDDHRLNVVRNNLCKKAVDALRAKYHFTDNFIIRIHKEIPFKAGLGGGSSNAATVLLALTQILKLKATKEDLIEIGKTIGADIPFFIENKPALVEGIGEKMTPIKVKLPMLCLLVKPIQGLATKDVFEVADNHPKMNIDTKGVIDGLKTGNYTLLAKSIGNDLMSSSVSMLPVIGEIFSMLRKDGFDVSMMSGSGSCLYCLGTNVRKFKEAAKKYTKMGYIVKLTKILG